MMSPFEVIVKTSDGQMLESKYSTCISSNKTRRYSVCEIDVHQHMLETIIPTVNGHVIIVQSKQKELLGQSAKILEKDTVKERVVVQLDGDFSVHVSSFYSISTVCTTDSLYFYKDTSF